MDLLFTSEGAERAWPLVLALVERAPDDEALGFVAASPLEVIVTKHGPQFADRLLERARQDRRLRQALTGVWGWEAVPEPLRTTLLGLIGTEAPSAPQRPTRPCGRRPRRT